MENTETFYTGTWKDETHRRAINDFFYEHIFARAWIPLVLFILSIFVGTGLMRIDGWLFSPIFWAITGVIWGMEFIFVQFSLFYHRRYLACPSGTEYSVFVDRQKKEPEIVLKTETVSRSICIRRVFITPSFVYIGESWYSYVVLPRNEKLVKYLADNFLDKFSVPFRWWTGYWGL